MSQRPTVLDRNPRVLVAYPRPASSSLIHSLVWGGTCLPGLAGGASGWRGKGQAPRG